MDGRGRIAQSLNFVAQLRARPPTGGDADARAFASEVAVGPMGVVAHRPRLQRAAQRILRLRIPRGAGAAAALAVMLSGLGLGVVKGGHLPEVSDFFADVRDQTANALGFSIANLTVTGHDQLTREEVLAAAKVSGRSSLLFLDVDATRDHLKANPWVADATVRKLLPGQLRIEIKERVPFALWQKDRQVSVIADDGTVLESFVAPQNLTLPLVVGTGAETRAKEFLTLLYRFPTIRDQVRASILIGERRWNLRLRNGLDIKLPEAEAVTALERLVALDSELRLISRDIDTVDLRLPDRVTVRLSEKASQARQEQLKNAKKAKKGGRA